MLLASPKIVVLDSSTLVNVSFDYWSREENRREKSRTFLSHLVQRGVHVALTNTHVFELLRHGDEQLRKDRLRFLRGLRLVAWVRPYDRKWFPGGILDLLARELHAVVHASSNNWRDIVNQVRPDTWETGVGADMFVEDEGLWSAVHAGSMDGLGHEKVVASIARTDAGKVSDLKLCDALKLPRRPKEERAVYMRRFASEMKSQLVRHGDKKLGDAGSIAAKFAMDALADVEIIDALRGDPVQKSLEYRGVPSNLVRPEMTIGEIGEIAVYVKHLELISTKLRPPVTVSVNDVSPAALPSYFLERKLAQFQGGAVRVSGSDLGDRHIAPLIFYSDAVNVDKRTFQHLDRIRRTSELAPLMRPFFQSADYMEIIKHVE